MPCTEGVSLGVASPSGSSRRRSVSPAGVKRSSGVTSCSTGALYGQFSQPAPGITVGPDGGELPVGSPDEAVRGGLRGGGPRGRVIRVRVRPPDGPIWFDSNELCEGRAPVTLTHTRLLLPRGRTRLRPDDRVRRERTGHHCGASGPPVPLLSPSAHSSSSAFTRMNGGSVCGEVVVPPKSPTHPTSAIPPSPVGTASNTE